MKPYSDLRPSRIPWMNDVPDHWTEKRIKHLAQINPPKSEVRGLPADTPVTFLPMEAIGERGELDISRTKTIEDVIDGYSYCGEGDVILAKITPCFENGKGAVAAGLVNGIGFATTEVIPLRCSVRCDNRFLYYLLYAVPFRAIAEGSMYGAGGQKRVADTFVANYPAEIPGPSEQAAIASFLDRETAKIDTLIDKQEQLIKLLDEKRQAVISHAVTKGLNPDVRMKDSGIEWLGKVPEHWEVGMIKHFAKIESGHTPDKKAEAYWTDCNIPWVSLNDSKTLSSNDYISETRYQVNALGIENSSARLLPSRAVVFTRDASIGLSAITTRPMAVSQHIIAWLCNPELLLPEFLLLVFYGMVSEFDRYTFGATIKTIGMDDVRSLCAAFPQVAEQREIVSRTFRLKLKIDEAIAQSERLVMHLRERRTALISAAVTGKIDVRNAV